MQAKQTNEEGKRLKGDQTPHIYLVLDGVLRHIPDPETYNNLFLQPWIFDTIPQAVIDTLPKGQPLLHGAKLYKTQSSPKVYLIDIGSSGMNCKRHIVSPKSFDNYGFNWGSIKATEDLLIDAIPQGENIECEKIIEINELNLHLLAGHRVKGESQPHIYLILDGQLRHIPNPQTYNNLFNQPWQFDNVSQDSINYQEKGKPLLDGTGLFQAQGQAEVYLLDESDEGKVVKRWIANSETFNQYGFNWQAIKQVDPLLMKGIETSSTINLQ